MSQKYGDRVQETTTTTGTGTVSLGGAVASYQTFSSILGTGDRCTYTIVDSAGNWEVGIGTYTSGGDTLSRDKVYASSSSGSLITIAAGTSNVWLDLAALDIANLGLVVGLTSHWAGVCSTWRCAIG